MGLGVYVGCCVSMYLGIWQCSFSVYSCFVFDCYRSLFHPHQWLGTPLKDCETENWLWSFSLLIVIIDNRKDKEGQKLLKFRAPQLSSLQDETDLATLPTTIEGKEDINNRILMQDDTTFIAIGRTPFVSFRTS